MKTPHVHAELIKAWADGYRIQSYSEKYEAWQDETGPAVMWYPTRKYRRKPGPVPDVVEYWHARPSSAITGCSYEGGNLKLTWDVEAGELKNAEVLK